MYGFHILTLTLFMIARLILRTLNFFFTIALLALSARQSQIFILFIFCGWVGILNSSGGLKCALILF